MALDTIKQTVAGMLNTLSASQTLAANERLAESGIAAEVVALAAEANADADLGELRPKATPSMSDIEIAAQLIASKTGMTLRKNIGAREACEPEDFVLLTIKFETEAEGIVRIGEEAHSVENVEFMTASLNRRLAQASGVAGMVIAIDASQSSSAWGRELTESLAKAVSDTSSHPRMDNVHVISSSSEPSMADKMAARRAAKADSAAPSDRQASPSA